MNPLSRIAGMVVDRVLGFPPAGTPYVVQPDVAVAMPNGVVLLGDHYRPAGTDRPLAVVLIRSPYGRAGLAAVLFAAPLARRGFQVFIQSTRGTFGSGGIRRLSPQTVPAPDVQIGDDGILAVDVELYPTAYRIQAGHRIRVQVSGGAFPRFARNFGTAEPFGAATTAVRCRFEIHHDSRHPACILLPVLPGR